MCKHAWQREINLLLYQSGQKPSNGVCKISEQLFGILLAGVHKMGGYVERIPYVHPPYSISRVVSSASKSAHDLKADWDIGNEICTQFDKPWLLQLAARQSGTFDLNTALDDLERLEA